ncbi:hypothetical protein ABW19_dt0208689 [Dactylella cylindrospora]|nr:hypothetical protein ABW19_dt0208689 [Dactylella cylindrospora]
MRQRPSTTRLPRSLLEQIQDLGGKNSGSKLSLKNTRARGRKERRKQERLEKKQTRYKQANYRQQYDSNTESSISEDEPQIVHYNQQPTPSPAKSKPTTKDHPTKPTTDRKPIEFREPAEKDVRKAVTDTLEEEDAEIAALEKKLKIKGKKLPGSFKEDNLDWLLEGLDSEDEERKKDRQFLAEKRGKKRKRDEDEMNLNSYGNRALHGESESEENMGSEDDLMSGSGPGSDSEGGSVSSDFDIGDADEGDWSGFSSSEESEDLSAQPRGVVQSTKPDPTKPAISPEQPAKYIPPAQRRQLSAIPTDDVLRKKIQGQVNRLTEPSMLQIVKSIEGLYREYPRQTVTSTLTTLVLASVSNEVNTKETFFTLYGGFVAALYKILGTDFGAYFVQRVVEDFDRVYQDALKLDSDAVPTSSRKQTNDLVSLLAELYNFGVIGSALIFDFIRIFVSEVVELNAELLLKIVRSSGPQLRQDDPSALKDIVTMLNASVARTGSEKLSTRFKFMVETLTNLKNNKARKSNDSSVVASEAIVRMKKTLGTLSSRTLRASEPLRPSLKDIRDVDKKGKWWLVGASWRNNMVEDDASNEKADYIEDEVALEPELSDDVTNYLQLAREQRMNTDIRRAIFVAIMSSEDYTDARERLFKLRLKRNQEREIPRVLLHCCGNEAQYNPYYTLIAQQLCSTHSLRMTFQFSLWEQFRNMGEEDDMNRADSSFDDGDDNKMPLRKVVNLAKLYGYLVAHGSLSLTILKTLQIVSLQPITRNFLEIFFITVFSEIRERYPKSTSKGELKIRELFMATAENPSLARGLEYFLRKHVVGSDITNGKKEREAVKQGCIIGDEVLKSIILDGADEA